MEQYETTQPSRTRGSGWGELGRMSADRNDITCRGDGRSPGRTLRAQNGALSARREYGIIRKDRNVGWNPHQPITMSPEVGDAVNTIEISDGVIDMSHRDKLSWLEKFSKHVEVFSEIGGKIERQTKDWKAVVHEELSAGAHKIVVEGREIGPVGQDIRSEFVDTVVESTSLDNLVFEAFERKQQVWMIKRFGPNVNLGNIPPTDLLTLESFRLGLKEHTLLHTFERSRDAAKNASGADTAAARR
jgi:hypothetical protein